MMKEKTYFKSQPELDDIARKICLSPAHFQRLFTAWAAAREGLTEYL
jgi:AraC-like DNA-binding protein